MFPAGADSRAASITPEAKASTSHMDTETQLRMGENYVKISMTFPVERQMWDLGINGESQVSMASGLATNGGSEKYFLTACFESHDL